MTLYPPLRPATFLASVVVFCALATASARAEAPDGRKIYREKCASCHGADGEGTKTEYPHPLTGSRSLGQLTKLIADTMPDDDPGSCTGPDAQAVAAFIHEAFYSRTAQARNKAARVELSRLTVRQYRNTITDLIGSFRAPSEPRGEARGLRGEYFDARGFRGDKRVIDRIDPVVSFDFGTEAPVAEKFDPAQFSIRWQGSVFAPESGEYEFVVKCDQALRLYVNDNNKPLIDAWVKSGSDKEFRASIPLLGGRWYILRLEFTKAKQGVDDSKTNKRKPKPVPAMVALEWKPPQRVLETIPARCLSPSSASQAFVLTTPFPPDDRSVGYERGSSISKEWDQATTDAAIEAAGYVSARLRELSGVFDPGKNKEKVRDEFCRNFVERAFRRPLTNEERALHVDRQFERSKDVETAVKRVVLLALKSPEFLYREPGGGHGGYDVASRLSFGLWDSMPDKALLNAAASGKLATREQVAAQAERMLNDPRTRSKVREFLLQWLRVDLAPDLSKDPGAYPEFSPSHAADLRTSLDLFLDEAVWGESSDFRQLLLADFIYLNSRLARFYGIELPEGTDFTRMTLDPRDRAGVLSHPYLLATFAYTATSSPIHRGVFLARSVLGRALRTPPAAVAPLAPDLHPSLSTRERVALQTKPEACQTCHVMINSLGFALERFDAAGRFRATEKGRPVDASGAYLSMAGETATFDGARDLGTFLADSDETHQAFVEQLFHYLVKQPIRAYGPDALRDLTRSFAAREYNVRKLIVDEVTMAALWPTGPTH
jgi:hypothetical protein